jgi:Ribosomal protein L6P/L9E
MSRIAKNSIKISKDTNCSFDDGLFKVKGKLGEISLNINPLYRVEIKDAELFVNPINEKK